MSKKRHTNMQRRRPLTDRQKQFKAEQYVASLGLPHGTPVDVYVAPDGEVTASYQQPPGWKPPTAARSFVIPPRTIR